MVLFEVVVIALYLPVLVLDFSINALTLLYVNLPSDETVSILGKKWI